MEISEIACKAIKEMYDAGYTINEIVRIYHYPGELIRIIVTRK